MTISRVHTAVVYGCLRHDVSSEPRSPVTSRISRLKAYIERRAGRAHYHRSKAVINQDVKMIKKCVVIAIFPLQMF